MTFFDFFSGRDTQDTINFAFACNWFLLLVQSAVPIAILFISQVCLWVVGHLGVCTLLALLAPVHWFTQKHGWWKCNFVFPVLFIVLSALAMSMPTSAFMVSQATTVKVCETSHWVWSVWEPSFEDLIQSIGDPPPTFVEHHFANEFRARTVPKVIPSSLICLVQCPWKLNPRMWTWISSKSPLS